MLAIGPGVERLYQETWWYSGRTVVRLGVRKLLDDAIAWLDCELVEEHDAGDHTIAVARVLDLASAQDGRALVFFRGQYGRFVPTNLDQPRRENA
ncbi:hypothetical protein FRAHR75_460004 [Frankia sp. Hr75.2]|nr:hypothetical protein FRAHR75_460004 [Frankia sp. Hr75.2]